MEHTAKELMDKAKEIGPKLYPHLPYGRACERAYQSLLADYVAKDCFKEAD